MKNIQSTFTINHDNLSSCSSTKKIAESKTPFVWEGANVYFLMTDRFNNGDKSND
jgi:alpha-amylase